MNLENLKLIIIEINKLKDQNVKLCSGLDCDQIMTDFEDIQFAEQTGKYVLAKKYFLIKRVQKFIRESLVNTEDVNIFVPLCSIVERIRKQ